MVYIYQFCLNMFVILFEYLLLLTIFICHFCLNFDVFATLVWTYLPLLFLLLTILYHLCLNIFVTSIWIFAFADDLYLPLLFCLLLFRQCRLSRGHSTKWDSGYFTLSNFIKLALFDLIAITHIPQNYTLCICKQKSESFIVLYLC